jgi:hypothetical protein
MPKIWQESDAVSIAGWRDDEEAMRWFFSARFQK